MTSSPTTTSRDEFDALLWWQVLTIEGLARFPVRTVVQPERSRPMRGPVAFWQLQLGIRNVQEMESE